MKMKKWIAGALTAALLLGLSACGGKDTAVYVQSVAEITGTGAVAMENRFPGMVVSENVTEIKKDTDKTVAELKVKEGDDVQVGQELFAYDAEEIQLSLDKQKLELEQIQAQIDNYKDQISTLEKEKKNAGKDAQAQYTVDISAAKLSQKEAELNLKNKKAEVEATQKLLQNVKVTSPVAGRIQSINENGTDSNGNPAAYITIQQEGSFRIKGTLGELNEEMSTYEVLEGLTAEDYIAYPDETLCKEGVPTTHEYVEPTDDGNGENGGVNDGVVDGGAVDGGVVDGGIADDGNGAVDGGYSGTEWQGNGMGQSDAGISSDESVPDESMEG